MDQLASIFRMAEVHGVSITFSYSEKWHAFKIEVRKGAFYTSQYIKPRDMTYTGFIFDLIRNMIDSVEKAERLNKNEKENEK